MEDLRSIEEMSTGVGTTEENRRVEENEKAMLFASMMKLPTFKQLRMGILKSAVADDGDGDGGHGRKRQLHELKLVDVRNLTHGQRREFIEQAFKDAEEDNERFLMKLRERILRVGIELPTVEVRFEKLNVEGECHFGRRALPTLANTAINTADSALRKFGVSLTKRSKLTILNNVSGIIRPSRMTLLLGPPASGKTTLLKALAGNLNSSLKVNGEVTYNGYKFDEFVPQKSAAYIGENDVHVPAMTVRETLDFSARCQGVSAARYDLLKELLESEKAAGILPDAEIDLFMKATSVDGVKNSLQTEYIIKILGLDSCANVLVGDEMRTGISGGQKKRLTTGEVIVGPTKVLFMDETSTGLDSSTTYQIVKCLQQIVHLGEATILMSLLQPEPETFKLFDDIILLSEGQIVYQGPREYILDFFGSCGFCCPERKSIADFLQEIISRKDQAQYWADHTRPYRYITAYEFADLFNQFHIGLHLKTELSVPFDESRNHQAALVFKKHAVPFSELLAASFTKEWLFIKRNLFLYLFKSIQIMLMALVVSTVFSGIRMQTNTISDGIAYNGALLFGMIINLFNGIIEISVTIARLPIFYKHRDLHFYPAWIFTLPIVFLRIPISVLESIVWVIITYCIIGFAPEAGRFLKHLLVIFFTQQMAYGLFRAVAGLCRTIAMSGTVGILSILFFLIVGGFFLPKDLLPEYWVWGYWISPLTYGYNALAVNEFLAPRWMNKSEHGKSLGLEVLENINVFPEKNWYWIGVCGLAGFAIFFNVLYTLALAYLRPLDIPQAVISETMASNLDANIEKRETSSSMKVDAVNCSSPPAFPTNDEDKNREMVDLQKGHSSESVDVLNSRASFDVLRSHLPKRGMVLPFTPLIMTFHDVNYYINNPTEIKNQGETVDRIQLLNDITGAFRSGVLTALMGMSGAGKTTLMDVLAGRKNVGYIKGDIRISGYPKNQATFTRVLGYCEQSDIHSPQITVNESLISSAFLRLPMNVNNEEKMKFVDEVMKLVELTNIKDAIVGLPGVSGLSTEQRKRLTIAVELVANPSIIFMDEPTTGLDARAAAIVMRAVRNIVDTGRTIVCTIHQPSIDIFESFDELLLLKRGQIIYSGSLGRNSQKMIEYFKDIPGVPKIKENQNPATWMLAITSNGATDFAEYYQSSYLYQRNRELVNNLSKPVMESEDLYFPSKYSQTIYAQFRICLWKHWWTYWRTPRYNLVRLLFTCVTSIILGSTFWRIGRRREDANDLRIVIGSMLIASQFIGITNCSTVQPVVATERTVFYRERAAGMYSAVPYAIAQMVVEIPYVLLQSLQFSVVIYSMMSFQWTAEKFFWFFFISFFSFLYFTYYGMMTVSISPNHQVAAILSSTFYSVFSLFAGFYIPKPRIAKAWIWYYWICPLAWTVYGLIVSQFGDVEDIIRVPGQAGQPIKLYVKEQFGYDRDLLGIVGVVLVSFCVFFCFYICFLHPGIKFPAKVKRFCPRKIAGLVIVCA